MFIKGSLSAQRFITAIDMTDQSKTEEVSRQLWMRIWSRVGFGKHGHNGNQMIFFTYLS